MPFDLFAKIQPFAIALALGLLIGIERERAHPPGQQPLGLRTFILFGLLGALAARLTEPLVSVAITVVVGAVVIAGYIRSSKPSGKHPDIGFTTEVAAIVTYGLGYLAYYEPLITLIIGVAVLVVLLARTRLHQFSRKQVRPRELQAAATILVIGLCILPFIPNKAIDPWKLFNFHRLGILALALALIQFMAYVGIRVFGTTKGLLLSGFLSGFVSSTAATATLSQQAKGQQSMQWSEAAAIVLSTVAMFIQLQIITFIIDPLLLKFTAIPFVISGLIAAIIALAIGRYKKGNSALPAPKNPLALSKVLRMAVFLFSIFIIVSFAQHFLGPKETGVVVFLSGLVEMQGIMLSMATLHSTATISAIQALDYLSIAIIASFISKFVLVWSIARGRFALVVSLLLTLMLAIYCVSWWATVAFLF